MDQLTDRQRTDRIALRDIYRGPLALAFAASIASVSGATLLYPVLPVLAADLKVDEAEIGLVMAAFTAPAIVLAPLFGILADLYGRRWLLIFGLGLQSEIAFGALHGIVPVMMFTMNAVRNIKPVLVKTARVLGLSAATLMRTVLMPAAFPEIFTGLRIGFSVTLLGTVMSEMFGSKRGLGFLLMNALGVNNVELIMSLALLLIAFAAVANSVLMAIERRISRVR